MTDDESVVDVEKPGTDSARSDDDASASSSHPSPTRLGADSLAKDWRSRSDPDAIAGDVPSFDLDLELAQHPSAADLQRIETRISIKSRVSRAVSVLGHGRSLRASLSRKEKRERIAFAPIPTTDLAAGVVGWDGQEDPAMPLNFANSKKWLIVGLVSAITFVTPFASSILAPGIGAVDREFNNTNDIIGTMTVSIYLLGYVIGPLFLAPLSEIYGRRVVLSAANAFFCVWQIGCALAPSIEILIVFRFFSGIGGAGCLTLGAGVIADVFRTDERGFAMGIYTLGPLLGPTLGPLIGGFVSQSIGWRWDFWIVFIVGTVIVLMTEIFIVETNPHVLMARKVKRLQKELGRPELRSCYVTDATPKSHTAILINGLVRPTKMLFLSPLVFSLSLYMAFTYGGLYLLFTTIPVVFQETYHWDIGLTGLVYICLGLGNLAGWAVITAFSDKSVVRQTKANGGIFEPEMRLPMSIGFSFCLPITFFWYGWTTHFHTHWIWPVLGLFPFSFAIIGLYLPIITYLVDCYPVYAASAVAANTVLRSLVGMLLPLAGPIMYKNLGLGWGNSVLGFICVAMIPVPMLIHRYGRRLRMKGIQL
ncbi:major facilitator superfamily domain-containing protein [Schizothecium vesticola]|uniref:Major facilitator superfamily domain-containing protein n=1 Tax=Schizothecium vesticola TaxID=314040 RepID=A0AA40EG92_9PEZI|nr:major facilitator superfamily domain-containing protein [Schizothecium vesticola]